MNIINAFVNVRINDVDDFINEVDVSLTISSLQSTTSRPSLTTPELTRNKSPLSCTMSNLPG